MNACYKQTRGAFQSSNSTVVRLWTVITLQTLSVPRVRTTFASRGFSIAAPTVWNSQTAL